MFSRWEELVGPEIARHAQPRSLRGGVLVLTADQPAWATQLRYMGPELLARVRADAAAPEITEIQIRMASPGPTATGRGLTCRSGGKWSE